LRHRIRRFQGTFGDNEPNPEAHEAFRDSHEYSTVERALAIYGALADRSETKGAREGLSKHLMKLYIDGESDEHRLTVDGISYLRNHYHEIDSRS
jgi:hypothetical protein